MTHTNRVLVLDGNNVMMRSYHATFMAGMTRSDGVPSGALFTGINMMRSMIRELSPSHMLWFFDAGESESRLAKDPDYKGHRRLAAVQARPMANPRVDLPAQYDALEEFLDIMGIKHYKERGVEADDLLAQAAVRWADKDTEVIIVSNDHDMLQLINDDVKVLRPGGGKVSRGGMGLQAVSSTISCGELFDDEAVMEKYEMPPNRLAEVWALTGDSGDNVKGIPGVGQKTAVKWLKKHGELHRVLQHEMKCNGHEHTCWLAYQLIKLDGVEGNVPFSLDECVMPTTVDQEAILGFYQRWQMNSLAGAQ